MSVVALEGVVRNGQIHLIADFSLPENAKVFIVIPEIQATRVVHLYSPRLVHREQVKDFVLEVVDEQSNGTI
jgi:hypothetical protein